MPNHLDKHPNIFYDIYSLISLINIKQCKNIKYTSFRKEIEMNNKEKLAESKDMLESAIAQSMAIYGVSPSVGRIYSVLYFTKIPMTLSEIQDHVSMSKA